MYQQRPPTDRTRVAAAPSLLAQVLGITAIGFLITATAAYIFKNVPPIMGIVGSLGGLGLLFAMSGARGNPRVQLLLFYAFTFLEGIGIAPMITRYTGLYGSGIVVDAATTTGMGMLILGAIAYAFSFDWRRLSGIAFGALIALLVVGLISAFTHFLHPGVYAWLTLGVFSLLTLVDFARIRGAGNGYGANAVDLAVSIYLDAINIFIALLSIFGGRSRDR
jgi:modulator of FtsH protease